MAFSIDGLVNGRLGTAAGLGGITGAVKNLTGLDIAAEAGNAAKAFFGNEYMRDFTHASKTFIPNNYAYAPKFKHLFHVYFDINTELTSLGNNWPEGSNFGLAVKSISLPKYTFELHTMNQYNHKRITKTKIKYDSVQIKFHDDNNNIIRKLWHAYYTYYYKDAAQIDVNTNRGAVLPSSVKPYQDSRNLYDSVIPNQDDWGYIGEGNPSLTSTSGLKGNKKLAFFKSIKIFGFNQHNFALYQLINPVISAFSHDQYSYADNGVMENDMTVEYETVKYFDGALNGRNPGEIVTGFGDPGNYDNRPSPLGKAGSNASIMGQGGLVDAADGIIDDLSNLNFVGALQKAGTAYNTFDLKNGLGKTLNIAKGEAGSILSNKITAPSSRGGFDFPSAATTGINNGIESGINMVKGAFSRKSPPTQPQVIGPGQDARYD